MALGEILRNARVAKGYTPSQVAESTHLLVQIVEDLEQEDFHRIAAAIYGRGFVKLYAEFLGLDPDPLVREFLMLYDGSKTATVKTRAEPVKPQTLPVQNRVYPDAKPAQPATAQPAAPAPIATRRPAFNSRPPAPEAKPAAPAASETLESQSSLEPPAAPEAARVKPEAAESLGSFGVQEQPPVPVPESVSEPVPEESPISVSPDPDPLPALPLVRSSANQTLHIPKREERIQLTRSPENRVIQLPGEPEPAEPPDPVTIHIAKKAGPIHVAVEEAPAPKPLPNDGSLLPGLFPASEYAPEPEPEPVAEEEPESAPKRRFRFREEKSPEQIAAEKAAREERRQARREAFRKRVKRMKRKAGESWHYVVDHLRGIAVAAASLAAAVFVIIGIRTLFKMTERQAREASSELVEVCDPPPAMYAD